MAAILTVVIMGAAILIIGKSATFISVGELEIGLGQENQGKLKVGVEACLEETMRRYQINSSYSASNFELSIGDIDCTINTDSQSQERTITVEGNVSNYYKKMEAVIEVDDTINLVNWRELSI